MQNLGMKEGQREGREDCGEMSRTFAEDAMKPVQLLMKSLNELTARSNVVPLETMRALHECYKKERFVEHKGITRTTGGSQAADTAVRSGRMLDSHQISPSLDAQTGPVVYADLCSKEKSARKSVGSLSENKDSEKSSSGRPRNLLPTKVKMQKLSSDIKRHMCITVSNTDRKIAALMLERHAEEQERLAIAQQEEQKQEEAREEARAQREQAEKQRRRKLRQSQKWWYEELGVRRRWRERQEQQRAKQLEKEVLLQEERWRRLKEKVDVQRRKRMEAAQRAAEERKRVQEKQLEKKEKKEQRGKEREQQVAHKKEERARRRKEARERREQRRLQEENRRDLLRHILLKREVEQKEEEEEAERRNTLQRKLQSSSRRRAITVEAQLRELQERSAREEEQIQRARLRAELQSIQQRAHSLVLLRLSQQRASRAALLASSTHRSKAQEVHQHNTHRRLRHLSLRKQICIEEQEIARQRREQLSTKEWRRERLQRQREQILEEAQRLAQASFHLRESARQHRGPRSFHQMDLEAQLAASMSRIKLTNE